jgi:conjugative transfer region protein TrbK
MSGPGDIKRLLLVTTATIVPVLVVAACAIQLRGDGETTSAGSTAFRAADQLAAKLEHCRTVTHEQMAELEECRRTWTESRRRLLGQKKAPAVDVSPNDELQPKDRSSLPQDWPPVATPKSE